MGFSTSYVIKECKTYDFDHGDILVKNKYKQRNICAKLSYLDTSGNRIVSSWKTIKDETYEGLYLEPIPDGAYLGEGEFWKICCLQWLATPSPKKMGHVSAADKKYFVAYRHKGDEYLPACVGVHWGSNEVITHVGVK